MPLNLDRTNDRIRGWTKDSILKMKAEGRGLSIVHRADSPSKSASLPKIKDRYKLEEGTISRISFAFPRQLIWTHKGAGKGRAGTVGSKWTDKYGSTKSTNPKSHGKMATGGRTAKPFFDRVLDREDGVEELATIVAEETGDAIIGNLFIK